MSHDALHAHTIAPLVVTGSTTSLVQHEGQHMPSITMIILLQHVD